MDFAALSIGENLYTVPKEDYLDLISRMIPSLPEIFNEGAGITVIKELRRGMTIQVVDMYTLLEGLFSTIRAINTECDSPRLVVVRNTINGKIYHAYFTKNEPILVFNSQYCSYTRDYYDLEKYPALTKLADIIGFSKYTDHMETIRRRMFGMVAIPDFSNIINLTKSKEGRLTDMDCLKELIGRIYSENISIIDIDTLIRYKLLECGRLAVVKYDLFRALLTDIDAERNMTYHEISKSITIS